MSVKHCLTAGAFVLFTTMPTLVSAAGATGDAEAGKAKATTVCSACHGANGVAMIPGYPNLAGQNDAYLVSALHAYKNKSRNGGQAAIMQGQAAMLSDQEIADLAAYFSSLPAGGK